MRLQPAMQGARDSRPLAGRRIVVTRARGQADELMRALAALGADVVAAPTIRIEPLPAEALAPLRAALADLSRYRWVVFTSRNTVDEVWRWLDEWALAPDFSRAAVAAIGPATAQALARRGVRPEVVPARYVAEAVVEAIAARGSLAGTRVLVPRAAEARDALPDGLRALGADVEVIPVYRTVPESGVGDGSGLAAEIAAGRIDAVTFTSSSTVRGFVGLVGRPAATAGRFAAAAIGPVTSAAARELGIPVAVEARDYTTGGLVEALVEYFRETGKRETGNVRET